MRVAELAGSRCYLDANIFIYAIENTHPNSAVLTELLALVDKRIVQAATSQITLAEVLVRPYAERDDNLIQQYSTILGPGTAVSVLAVTSSVLDQAARLRAMHRMKLVDAIHLATALQAGCNRMVSNDDRLAKVLPGDILPVDILRLTL